MFQIEIQILRTLHKFLGGVEHGSLMYYCTLVTVKGIYVEERGKRFPFF
jgi:hypothetical protein